MPRHMTRQNLDTLYIIHIGEPLKTADPNMAVRQPDQNRRPGWRWLVIALQALAGFNYRKTA